MENVADLHDTVIQMIDVVAEKIVLANLSSSPHKKIQSKGKSCYIDTIHFKLSWKKKWLIKNILAVKVNYLVISKWFKTILVLFSVTEWIC